MTGLEKLILALLINLCLLASFSGGQLSAEQEADLSQEELYINEFLKGFRMQDINSRFYNCLWEQNRIRREFNYTLHAFREPDEEKRAEMFPDWKSEVFNITELVSDELSLTWFGCARMGLDSYDWITAYREKFADSEKVYSYPVSVMQTMLAQIVYLTQLNVAIQEADQAGDMLAFSFLLGRICRTVLVIEPLPID